MTGYIHSIQSLGAVDGPGLRSVVFLQGCPLRCAYCHNPDTWVMQEAALKMEPEALAEKLLRFRPYYGKMGGVTFSGGEPLAQASFCAEAFRLLQEQGISTALDTSGQGTLEAAKQVLKYTDLVLADLKFLTEEEYRSYTGGSLSKTENFLALTEEMEIPLWIRHVLLPGITATTEYLDRIKAKAESYSNLTRLEWLPFHKLCLEKYEKLGLEFPLDHVDPLNDREYQELVSGIGSK